MSTITVDSVLVPRRAVAGPAVTFPCLVERQSLIPNHSLDHFVVADSAADLRDEDVVLIPGRGDSLRRFLVIDSSRVLVAELP